jgi:acyl dehydratase
MRERLYLEDLTAGLRVRSAAATLTSEDIVAFAAQYDPQPFHLGDDGAAGTLFQTLAASGWHTAAVTMRLQVESGLPVAGGIIGSRADELRWPRPVRPGDTLHVETEVLEARPSSSRTDQGWVKVRSVTVNQHGEPVQVLVVTLLAQRRPVPAG